MNNMEFSKTWKFNWKLWLPLAAILIIIVALGYSSLHNQASQKYYTGTDRPIIEIQSNESKIQIADKLYQNKMIKSKLVFLIFARINSQKWHYGFYQIPAQTSALDFISMFSSGQNLVIKITIPEGWRKEQIGRAMEAKGITSDNDFEAATLRLEGKLYPDTYYFKPNSAASDVVAEMVSDFSSKTAGLSISADDLILASIVERETDHDASEKSIIAGIYKNRLAIDMKLQADPTGIYANDTLQYSELDSAGQKAYKFWEVMSISELNALSSPYNTYYSLGLPPSPICNPSLETIMATKNYTKSDYYYFQHIKGVFYPAKTYAEHLQNAKNAN